MNEQKILPRRTRAVFSFFPYINNWFGGFFKKNYKHTEITITTKQTTTKTIMNKTHKHTYNFIYMFGFVVAIEKCKTLEKVIACSSGNKKGSGKFTCNPQLPGNIDNVGIKLIKNQEGSTGCVKSKSFRMVKRNRQWKVQVSQGCKGVFAFTYEKKGRISSV